MGTVEPFGGRAKLNYAYVECRSCLGNVFTVEVTDEDEPLFKFLHCEKCGASIPIKMEPVFNQ